jgi:WhiB family redox-sensing transcriptional regulator
LRRDHWREDALCLGLDSRVFFPEYNAFESRWDEAKTICLLCPVRQQCLDLVIGLDEDCDRWGVFGGMTPAQRRVHRDELRQRR